MTNKHKGSSFDKFLEEENLLENSDIIAIKRITVYQFEKVLKKRHLNKTKIAAKMHANRADK